MTPIPTWKPLRSDVWLSTHKYIPSGTLLCDYIGSDMIYCYKEGNDMYLQHEIDIGRIFVNGLVETLSRDDRAIIDKIVMKKVDRSNLNLDNQREVLDGVTNPGTKNERVQSRGLKFRNAVRSIKIENFKRVFRKVKELFPNKKINVTILGGGKGQLFPTLLKMGRDAFGVINFIEPDAKSLNEMYARVVALDEDPDLWFDVIHSKAENINQTLTGEILVAHSVSAHVSLSTLLKLEASHVAMSAVELDTLKMWRENRFRGNREPWGISQSQGRMSINLYGVIFSEPPTKLTHFRKKIYGVPSNKDEEPVQYIVSNV